MLLIFCLQPLPLPTAKATLSIYRDNTRIFWRRLVGEFAASDTCVEVVNTTTQDTINGCLPESQGSSLLLAVRTTSDTLYGEGKAFAFKQELVFNYGVELDSRFLNSLQACVDKSVDDNVATETLQDNAIEGGCDDFENAYVVLLNIEGAAKVKVSSYIVCLKSTK